MAGSKPSWDDVLGTLQGKAPVPVDSSGIPTIITDLFPEHFVGGGKRYGWDDSGSDLDVFVFCPKRLVKEKMQEIGAHEADSNNQHRYPGAHWKINLGGVDIDLLVFTTPGEFEKYEADHNLVADVIARLSRDEALVQALFNAKRSGVYTGKQLYRILLSAAEHLVDTVSNHDDKHPW